jgi:hypothetical protein
LCAVPARTDLLPGPARAPGINLRYTGTYTMVMVVWGGIPITLLVFAEVPGEHGAGAVSLRHCKGSLAEGMVFCKTARRRRGFPEDRRAVLGDLDEFCCNDSIEPDKICEHLLGFFVLHTEDVAGHGYLSTGFGQVRSLF